MTLPEIILNKLGVVLLIAVLAIFLLAVYRFIILLKEKKETIKQLQQDQDEKESFYKTHCYIDYKGTLIQCNLGAAIKFQSFSKNKKKIIAESQIESPLWKPDHILRATIPEFIYISKIDGKVNFKLKQHETNRQVL